MFKILGEHLKISAKMCIGIFLGIMFFGFLFILANELHLFHCDYLIYAVVIICSIGTTLPGDLIVNCKSSKEQSRLLIQLSFLFMLGITAIVILLQITRSGMLTWSFVRLLCILMAVVFVNLSIRLLAIRRHSHRNSQEN